jgi:Holliday junction resolvase RusA-like endonuclease
MVQLNRFKEVSFSLALENNPKAKARPRLTRRGVAFTPKATQEYETFLKDLIQAQLPEGWQPLSGPLKLEITFCFKVAKSWSKKKKQLVEAGAIKHTYKPDIDNLIKTIDAWNGLLWEDDSQIYSVLATKEYAEYPGINVTLIKGL